jgi:hypothetical protein
MYVFTDTKPDIRITTILYCDSRLVASPCPESSTGLASVVRMPAHPHRTVGRVIEILETVSLSPRRDIGRAGSRPGCGEKQLTNGLLARGYRPRRSAWCPSPRCSTPVDPLDPDAVREHACLVCNMIAAGDEIC